MRHPELFREAGPHQWWTCPFCDVKLRSRKDYQKHACKLKKVLSKNGKPY